MNLSEGRSALQRRRSDGSYRTSDLNAFLLQAELDIYSRTTWAFLRRTHFARTFATATTADVSASTNSADLTSSTGFFFPTSTGKRVVVGGYLYRVVRQTGTQAVRLDRPFQGTTATDLSLVTRFDEVCLPRGASSQLQAVMVQSSPSVTHLQPMSALEMSRMNPDSSGMPSHFSVDRIAPLAPPSVPFPTMSDSTGGSGPGAATYQYWYSYYDKQTGQESQLSSSLSVAIGNSNMWQATFNKNFAAGDHVPGGYLVRVYRSKANGSTPYLCKEEDPTVVFPTSYTFQDDVPDQLLGDPPADGAGNIVVRLWPYPDTTYQLQFVYTMEPRGMREDNDTPLMDARWHHVVLDGAEALMLEAADEQGRANQARARFEAGIARMLRAQKPNRQRVGVMGGRGARLVRDPKVAADWMWTPG